MADQEFLIALLHRPGLSGMESAKSLVIVTYALCVCVCVCVWRESMSMASMWRYSCSSSAVCVAVRMPEGVKWMKFTTLYKIIAWLCTERERGNLISQFNEHGLHPLTLGVQHTHTHTLTLHGVRSENHQRGAEPAIDLHTGNTHTHTHVG